LLRPATPENNKEKIVRGIAAIRALAAMNTMSEPVSAAPAIARKFAAADFFLRWPPSHRLDGDQRPGWTFVSCDIDDFLFFAAAKAFVAGDDERGVFGDRMTAIKNKRTVAGPAVSHVRLGGLPRHAEDVGCTQCQCQDRCAMNDHQSNLTLFSGLQFKFFRCSLDASG